MPFVQVLKIIDRLLQDICDEKDKYKTFRIKNNCEVILEKSDQLYHMNQMEFYLKV